MKELIIYGDQAPTCPKCNNRNAMLNFKEWGSDNEISPCLKCRDCGKVVKCNEQLYLYT